MYSGQNLGSNYNRNLSSSSIHLEKPDFSVFSQKNLLYLTKKQPNSQNIAEQLDQYYLPSMLDTYEAKQKTIPNPIQILQKVRRLQKRTVKFNEPSRRSSEQISQSTFSARLENSNLANNSNALADDLAFEFKKVVRKLIQQFFDEAQCNNPPSLKTNSIPQMVQQLLQYFQKIISRKSSEFDLAFERILKEKEDLISKIDKDKQSQVFFQNVSKRHKKNVKQCHQNSEEIVKKSQQLKNCLNRLEARKNSIDTQNFALMSSSNTNYESQESRPQSQTQFNHDSKLNSDACSHQRNRIHSEQDFEQGEKIENEDKDSIWRERARDEKEMLINFWKNYLEKIVDEYQSEIHKLKLQIKGLKEEVGLYQREINRANSFRVKG